MQLPPGFSIGAMREDEVAVLTDWAAREQWNPGLSDTDIAWAVDPDAFIALREGDALAGGGTIFSYAGQFGFMGLFIVRPDLRGGGLGTTLWHHRLQRLRARLLPGTSIGMDGVFDMAPFYARGGFKLAYRDLRFAGIAGGAADRDIIGLDEVDFAALDTFDRQHVAAPRSAFLRRWVTQPGSRTAALVADGALAGYGVARPCREGYKLGPVFAARTDLAERIIGHLMQGIEGSLVQLDVPEPNRAGVALAQRMGLSESFGCARMYHGPDPQLPVERIFGVTSFEFG